MPIVAFDSLTKSYGQTPALQGVSFDVMPGDSSTRGADRPSVRLSFTIK